MKLSGTRQLSAKPTAVWEKLNDTDVLRRCIPGCETLEKTGDNTLKAVTALSCC
jgi:carbon monoxide dehydrogenase subunit G